MIRTLTIFLDIDGVLTPIPERDQNRERLSKLELFEVTVRPFLDTVEIVLASSRRNMVDVDDFRASVAGDVARTVIGQTGASRNRKIDEINEWLEKHGPRNWIAIDDDESEFDTDSPLINVNPTLGFDRESARLLKQQLFRTKLPLSDVPPEEIGKAAAFAATRRERNQNILANDNVLREYHGDLDGLHDGEKLGDKVFERIGELVPDLAALAISAHETRRDAGIWFCEAISEKNPSTPLEYLIRGDYALVESFLRGIRENW